jgi:UDP-glucose 4-epimerase
MKVLVTGGAGFIGGHLSRALVGGGHEVVVLDDLSTGTGAGLAGLDVRLVTGSILDDAALADALPGVDSVVHLAGLGSIPRSLAAPRRTFEVNALGTVAVLEACRRYGVGHVIFASSSSVYGRDAALPSREDQPAAPASPYAASKLAAEKAALTWQAAYSLPMLVFRFFNVFGPGQRPDHTYAAVVPRFGTAALSGQPLVVHGDGRQSRDFTHVGSVVAALVRAVEERTTDRLPVNLAFGSGRDLLSIAADVGELVGRRLELHHEPERHGDVRATLADPTRLHTLLPGLEPVPFRDGLAQTLDWLRSTLRSAERSAPSS